MATDPLCLLRSARKLYDSSGLDWVTHTTGKLIKFRHWETTVDELRPIIEQSGVKYIPTSLLAEPAYLFPIHSPHGSITMAQVRYVRPVGPSNMRYQVLGHSAWHCGPIWIGMDEPTRTQIIRTRTVMIVEGPMDVLACRVVLGLNLPVICGLGKTLTNKHEIDLKLLGVQRVLCMWDQDVAGQLARMPESFPERVRLRCPAKDPSDCLGSYELGRKLYDEVQLGCSYPLWTRPISGEEFDDFLRQTLDESAAPQGSTEHDTGGSVTSQQT